MKKVLLAAIAILVCTATYAIPARPVPIDVTQPDGTKITIRLNGDENFHFTTSDDGFLLKEVNGFFYYATMKENGEIEASNFICKPIEKRSVNEKVFLQNIADKNDFRSIAQKVFNEKYDQKQRMISQKAPAVVGEKGIAILVNFSDLSFVTPNANAAFNDLLNKKGYNVKGAIGSVRDYFIAQSDSVFQPHFDVYGPYTLPQPMAYYGANTSSGNDVNASQMILDACVLASNDGVNFANYDTDGNGFIDNVFVYYAGYSEAEGGPKNSIWPHRSTVPSKPAFNGVRLYNYACSSELRGYSGSTMSGIGAFCHEFSHVLGLWDMYNTSSGNGGSTVGYWDLMDGGCYNGPTYQGDVPCGYSSYQRFYIGWLMPNLLKNKGSYSLKPLDTDVMEAFLVSKNDEHNMNGKNPDPALFFMLENRNKKSWDTYLPGSGMLIWRINYNKNAWQSNTVNNSKPYNADLIEANGIQITSSTPMAVQKGAAFPQSDVTSYVFEGWGTYLSDITRNGTNIDFNYNVNMPSKGQLNVKYDANNWAIEAEDGSYTVYVYNAAGILVNTYNFNGKITIDYSNYQSGAYMLSILKDDNGATVKYFAKARTMAIK